MAYAHFTSTEYIDMILIYGECRQNGALAIQTYRERYGNSRRCPSDYRTIVKAIQRLRENLPVVPRQESVSSGGIPIEKEMNILKYSDKNPTSSLRKTANHFGVSHFTVHKILKQNQRRSFKYTKNKPLLKQDRLRVTYCQWLLENSNTDPDFVFNILWTDENTFTPNGIQNWQNSRYWSEQNLHIKQNTGHQDKFAVTVWAGIHQNKILGPVFIDGHLNATKYLDLIRGPVTEYIDQIPLDVYSKMWFQADGAPTHCGELARNMLSSLFGDQWIGRYGPQQWPARSRDLTPLSFFLWSRIKKDVYASEVHTEDEVRQRIVQAFDKIKNIAAQEDLLAKARHSVIRRCNLCIEK